MTQSLFLSPFNTVFFQGTVATGAKMFFYETETLLPISIFDSAGTSLANPISADLFGHFVPIYIGNDTPEYRVQLQTATGSVIDDVDPTDNFGAIIKKTVDNYALSSGSSLIGFINSGSGAVPRTVQDKLRDTAGISDYGGVGDGTTDNTPAVNAALALQKSVLFQQGVFKFNSDIVIYDATISRGAVLKPAAGVTITIAGNFTAPLAKIFDTSLGGHIMVAAYSSIVARPEWWGAVVNDASAGAMTTNVIAIGAAIVASRVTELTSSDYFINSTLKITTQHRTLRGIGKHWASAGDSTRLIQMSPTADAIQMGPDTYPAGGIANFLQEIHIEDMSIVRGPQVTGNATWRNCPAGIRMQYILFSTVQRVWTTEHSIGVLFAGVVQCRVKEVFSFRSIAGTDAAHDPFFGFFYDGIANDGLAGGNASVYETDCNTIVGGAPPLTISAHSYGLLGFVDWFIERPESTTTEYGIVLDGTGSGLVNTQDIHIAFSVFDQCLKTGIKIIGGNNYTLINVTDPYVALNTGSTTGVAAIDIENCSGLVDITGGQILGGLATTGDVGIKVNNSSGVNIRGTLIRESKAPVQITNSSNCRIEPRINNPTVGTSGAGAIAVSGTNNRLVLAPQIVGGIGVFGPGVNLASTGTTNSTVDVSSIDPTACTASTKISYNSVAVNTATTFGTSNLSQGNFN